MKDLLMLKDKNNDSLLAYAARSKNAIIFSTVIAFVEHYISSQEVIWRIPYGEAPMVIGVDMGEAQLSLKTPCVKAVPKSRHGCSSRMP